MDKKTLINLNGKLLSSKDPVITVDNRSFRYGDGLFETIRVINNELHLYPLHFKRLIKGCDLLKLKLSSKWNEEFFRSQILDLLKEKGVEDNARVRLTLYRKAGGLFEPTNSEAEYLIEAEPLSIKGYPLNEEGMVVDIFSELEKPTNLYSTFKTSNALLYVMASLHKRANNLDDCLLINSKTRIIEGINSNVFLVKNGEISTPPTTEGCVAGVMREHLLKVMEENGISYQKSPINLEDLFAADEVFLSNSIFGIQWVKQYKVKTYELGVARILSEHINKSM